MHPSPSYHIYIYEKLEGVSHKKKTRYGEDEEEETLLCNFCFKIKYEPNQLGIHTSMGYLIDSEGAYRLAITVREINYNDIFSQHDVGKGKFEALLKVFDCESLYAIKEGLP